MLFSLKKLIYIRDSSYVMLLGAVNVKVNDHLEPDSEKNYFKIFLKMILKKKNILNLVPLHSHIFYASQNYTPRANFLA